MRCPYAISPTGQMAMHVPQQPYDAQAKGFFHPSPSMAWIGQFCTHNPQRVHGSSSSGCPAVNGASVRIEDT